jgi:hypothetical protein
MKRCLRGLLIAAVLWSPANADFENFEQPPFEVKDPAVSDNFREIYYEADRLRLLTSLFTYTFDSSTNLLCIDSPTFCVDATNNRTGILTATPVVSLEVLSGSVGFPATSGTTPATSTTVRIRPGDNAVLDIGGNSSNGAWFQSTDQTSLSTNYSLLFNPNGGNVSIGTTTASNALTVALRGAAAGAMVVSNSDNVTSGAHAQLTIKSGGSSGGDPYLNWNVTGTTDWSMGIDNSASDALVISNASSLGSSNYLSIGNSAIISAVDFFSQRDSAGGSVNSVVSNTNNGDAASHGFFIARTGGSSGGDPYINFNVANNTNWSMGIDNSDSDVLNITEGSTLGGVNTRLRMPTGGQLQMSDGNVNAPQYSFIDDPDIGMWRSGANAISFGTNSTLRLTINAGGDVLPNGAPGGNLGDASNYWNDVSYKTLTDRGCLGWFDDGVEMPDGTTVNDLAVFKKIKFHPTKKTVYGAPMLDYRTFPKVAYIKASYDVIGASGTVIEKRVLPRDQDDEPYYYEILESTSPRKTRIEYNADHLEGLSVTKKFASDGAEMTSMFSIMMGALKETEVRIASLEARLSTVETELTAAKLKIKALEDKVK